MWAGSVSLLDLLLNLLWKRICFVQSSTYSPFVSFNRLEVTSDISQWI